MAVELECLDDDHVVCPSCTGQEYPRCPECGSGRWRSNVVLPKYPPEVRAYECLNCGYGWNDADLRLF